MTKITPNPYLANFFIFNEDGWINMTAAAHAYGKRLEDFFNSPESEEYINALAEFLGVRGVLQVTLDEEYLTCCHPKLGLFFLRWLEPKTAMDHDEIIQRKIKDGSIRIIF